MTPLNPPNRKPVTREELLAMAIHVAVETHVSLAVLVIGREWFDWDLARDAAMRCCM